MAADGLAFNLGVDVGQLLFIGLVSVPMLWWTRQAWYRESARAGSVAILLIASWMVAERTLLM